VLHETVPIPEAKTKSARERAEREAYKNAQKVLTRLQAEADSLKVGRTKATVGALLERWMEQQEIDPTTRMNYEAQIRLHIVPNLGDVPLVLFVREAADRSTVASGVSDMHSGAIRRTAYCNAAVTGRLSVLLAWSPRRWSYRYSGMAYLSTNGGGLVKPRGFRPSDDGIWLAAVAPSMG
jgi:hypothetical protein